VDSAAVDIHTSDALRAANIAFFAIVLKYSLCTDTEASRRANTILSNSDTQQSIGVSNKFVTTDDAIRLFQRKDILVAIAALKGSATVAVDPTETERAYLSALYSVVARVWCISAVNCTDTDDVTESVYFAFVCANGGSRWFGDAVSPLARPLASMKRVGYSDTTEIGVEICEQLQKLCERREIQQKLVVQRECLVSRMSCGTIGPPYTRDAFEENRPDLCNQFDMCVYASVLPQVRCLY
jgi:hypothetical protein